MKVNRLNDKYKEMKNFNSLINEIYSKMDGDEKETSTDQKITNTVDELTYRNYCYNRNKRPDIEYKRWGKVFGEKEVEEFEAKYQNEKENSN